MKKVIIAKRGNTSPFKTLCAQTYSNRDYTVWKIKGVEELPLYTNMTLQDIKNKFIIIAKADKLILLKEGQK